MVALHWTDPRGCKVNEIGVEGSAFKEVFYSLGGNPLIDMPDNTQLVIPARDVFHVKLATPRHPLIGETWLTALAWNCAAAARSQRLIGICAEHEPPERRADHRSDADQGASR